MKIKIIFFVFFSSLIYGCGLQENENSIENLNLYLDKFSNKSQQKLAVLVVGDNGCPSCNKIFSTFVSNQLNNKNCLFIISANSSKVDISNFINKKASNVIIDDKKEFERFKLLKSSGLILMDRGEIDTIINIEANRIDEQLMFIENKINTMN